MSITINTKVYNADAPSSKDSVPYIGPGNSLSSQDKLELSRTFPKEQKDFSGVARSRVKLTRTLTLTNAKTTTGLGIVDVNITAPVGATAADVSALIDDVAAGLAQAWADDLAVKLDIMA